MPANVWALAGQLGEQWQIAQIQALRVIIDHIGAWLDETKANVLGPVFKSAYEHLLASDAIAYDGLPGIDISKIHRSDKTRSGFVGVYANGKGFRAMAKMLGDGKYAVQKSIGTFPTAERAGWARYLHYKKHKLPYGVLEEKLEELKRKQSQFAKGFTDEQLKHYLIWDYKDAGIPLEGLEPEDRALERVHWSSSMSTEKTIELTDKMVVVQAPSVPAKPRKPRGPVFETPAERKAFEDEPPDPIDGIPSFTEPDDDEEV